MNDDRRSLPRTEPRHAPREGGGDSLDRPLASAGITGLTAPVARKLAAKGICTVRDLIEQTPRRYVDLSQTKKIGDVRIGEEATILGIVKAVDGRYLRGRKLTRGGTPNRGKHMLTVRIGDGTGYIEAVWWNQPFRTKQLAPGMTVAVAGKFEKRMGRLQVTGSFFVERVADDGEGDSVHTGRIIPVHPATEGVSATMLRRYVHSALRMYAQDGEPGRTDPLPEEMLERLDLMPRWRAFRQIHFPSSLGARVQARKRLAFEELVVLSAGLAVRKRRIERETPGVAHAGGAMETKRFLESLPFDPTGAQQRAIDEILQDMALPIPMHRLLQGEVGSGKTVVAVAAAIAAAASGTQAALMAPTEVLAEQHFLSITQMLKAVAGLAPEQAGTGQAGTGQLSLDAPGFRVELLTGSVTGKERERAMSAARTGEAHLMVGTHALIQGEVAFAKLGLAIVDEQHRFGVHQRIALRGKAAGDAQPDLLIMTATPIPRTLAMTLYGDLDVSTLDEMPPGRTPVRTVVLTAGRRDRAEDEIRSQVAAGRQAFVVCALVEQSATLEVKSAETEFERIRELFPDLRVGLIHGRLRPAQKEAVMTQMRSGDIDVLVATTVIEVGVDIPNATVMVVEDADRFGLSQLHQLRGRIGRGMHPGTCFLLTSLDPGAEDEREIARRRLAALAETNDGFRLAELDLEIRGGGQIFGRSRLDTESGEGAPAQAGATDLRFASLLRDGDLLAQARREAFRLVDADPHLQSHPALLAEVRRRFADRLDWLFAG